MYERIEVYALCSTDGTPHYVGSTSTGVGKRFTNHISRAIDDSGANDGLKNWIRELVQRGKRPAIIILEECYGSNFALERERAWYQWFREQGIQLFNLEFRKSSRPGRIPKTIRRTCEWCDEDYMTASTRSKYCCNAHKIKSNRLKRGRR